MLLQFYQTHLESQLSTAEFIFLKILVNLLQSIKQVNLEKLANILPLAIKFESRRKRIQRFLAIPHFTIENIWLPLIKQLIESYLSPEEIIYLAIDRTNWGEINLLLDFRLAGSRNRLNWVEKVEKEKRKNARKLRS
jgi:hypothetical protein